MKEEVNLLRAPFPWFGGKSRATELSWERLGDVPNFVEPFCGSLAMVLQRPHVARCETVNDKDCLVANFWRSVSAAPGEVARWADWPVNEADLHARHRWLVEREGFAERMKCEPDFYDAQIAGWWVWGICQWIGGGWCEKLERRRPMLGKAGNGVHRKLVDLRRSGHGVHRKRPLLHHGTGIGVTRQLPMIGGDGSGSGRGVHRNGLESLEIYFEELASRLRRVRVCCGDWKRVLGPSPTFKIGVTGVFLDPPYGGEAGRDNDLYREEDLGVAAEVQKWAVENGANPMLRIALCGYEGEHVMPQDWECVAWKANGGYGNQAEAAGRENARRERIWFSPHCLKVERDLFGQ